ncbi:GNAT family N-acetyltransferase [[Muricauda] lutisoli]|uniref:GNAT family N-acetyltransferase n=1 Tax=[Muricauda] lutisoli TaxID=2816035 RepID=UPI001F5C2CE5|nr:GNAT family N-acetyltransferase [[Muricauda] lutisoli]
MVRYKQAETLEELEQILDLQQRNLPKNITEEESTKEGFVTVEHTLDVLKAMNEACGHIIAVDKNQVVGYALCMHPKFAEFIEVLRPMFREIDKILEGKLNYMAMGQICVAKSHRGQGIFRKLYQTMKEKLP